MADAPEPPFVGAPDPVPEPEPAPVRGDDSGVDVVPPMLPSRGAYLLAFGATAVAGILGAIIGFGIVDVTSDSGIAQFVGALVGALVGAIGVGVVAVLVLRAMAEWKRQPRDKVSTPVRRRS